MKLLLIFPRFKHPSGDPPLGVAYLAATLERAGHEPLAIYCLAVALESEDGVLLLERLDQGGEPTREPVALDELAADAVRDARAAQPERPISGRVWAPGYLDLAAGGLYNAPSSGISGTQASRRACA